MPNLAAIIHVFKLFINYLIIMLDNIPSTIGCWKGFNLGIDGCKSSPLTLDLGFSRL